MTRLPPDVLRLMRHRIELGAVEDTHREYVARVQVQAEERRALRERARDQWARYRRHAPERVANVGARIARERERLRMSVGDLAELVDMWEVELEMVEAGEAEASEAQLVELATALFTSVGVLTGEEPPRV
ncbi:hypothetical protein ACXYTP_21590 [Tsukamurella ocularis]